MNMETNLEDYTLGCQKGLPEWGKRVRWEGREDWTGEQKGKEKSLRGSQLLHQRNRDKNSCLFLS